MPGVPGFAPPRCRVPIGMLFFLAVLIAIIAVAGGVIVTKFIFLVLLIALLLAAIGAIGSRT